MAQAETLKLPPGMTEQMFLSLPRDVQMYIYQQQSQAARNVLNGGMSRASNKPSLNDITGIAKNEATHSGLSALLGGGESVASSGIAPTMESGITGLAGIDTAVPSTIGPLSGAPETMGAAPAGVPAAAALATILGTRWGLRTLQGKTKNWKDASLADNAGRLAAATATMGGSEIANYVGNKFFGHKSTKERQAGNWADLVKEGQAPAWAAGTEDGTNQDQGDLRQAKTGRDVWATSGMFKTFGPDWADSYDETKREAIAKKMLDEGLFQSKKGITNVTNADRARQIADEIGGAAPVTNLVGNLSPGTAQTLAQPDAGTLKRWRIAKANKQPGFTGR